MKKLEQGNRRELSQECPLCGKTYDEHPAISREDGHLPICPECGIREALTAAGMDDEEQDQILGAIRQHREEVRSIEVNPRDTYEHGALADRVR